MPYEYSEDQLIEKTTEDVLNELGWQVVTARKNELFKDDRKWVEIINRNSF